jgi:hypothetical protein
MNQPYGPLAGNSRISARINQLLPLLDEEDQRKFLKKFRNEAAEQAAHTFRELVLGAFLLKNGFIARYEMVLGGKTPDWLLYGSAGQVQAVVDQLTFHQAKQIDDEMNQALRAGSAGSWWLPDNTDRLYQKLYAKAETYEKLATQHAAASLVSVFGDVNAVVEQDELEDTLHRAHGGGIFARTPWLSGVIYFQEQAGSYDFSYFSNPSALHPLHIAGGRV